MGGLTGLGGGEGAVSITSGLSGLSTKEKISKVLSNASENRSRYIKSLNNKNISEGILARSKTWLGRAGKYASDTENLTYGLATAPIVGTALGNALGWTRQKSKNVIAKSVENIKKRDKEKEFQHTRGSVLGVSHTGNSEKLLNDYSKIKHKSKKEIKDALKKKGFVFNENDGTFRIDKPLSEIRDEIDPILSAYLDKNSRIKLMIKKYKARRKKIEKATMKEEDYKNIKNEKDKKKYIDDKVEKIVKPEFEPQVREIGFTWTQFKESSEIYEPYDGLDKAYGSGDKKKIVKYKKEIIEVLDKTAKEYHVKPIGEKIVKMMETSEGRLDVREMMDSALSTKDPEMFIRTLSAEINGNKLITAKERVVSIGGGIAKAIKTEFINPAVSEVRERFYSVRDILGKMKNYNLISGVGLVSEYNNEINDTNSQINKLMYDYNDSLEALKNPNSTQEEKAKAQKTLNSLQSNLEVLLHKKEQLERSRKYVESPELLVLSLLNKKAIDDLKLARAKEGEIISTRDAIHKLLESGTIKSPLQALDNLAKLASGDELARINLTRAMLDNELRIKKKSAIEAEKEINKIKEALKNENLTEIQRLQYKKMEEEVTYKYNMLNSETKRIELDAGDLNDLVKSLKVIKKPVIATTKYTIEKELGNYVNTEIIENSELSKASKKKKLLIDERNKLDMLNKIAESIKRENIKNGKFELVNSAIKDENLNLINDVFKDDADAKVINRINDVKIAMNSGKNAINVLDVLGREESKKILESAKESLSQSLSKYKATIESTNNPELIKKYDAFVNSVVEKITIESLKNTSIENLSNEIKTEFENTGLDKTMSPVQISDAIINSLGDKAITNEIYEAYNDVLGRMSEKIKENSQTRGEIIEKSIKEISEKEDPLFKKDIFSIIYGPKTKNIYMTNQKTIRDREIAESVIKNIVEKKAKDYNLQKSTMSILSSFDHHIDEIPDEKEKEKAIEFAYKEIVPELKNMNYNLFAKVVSNKISDYEYARENGGIDTGFFNEQEVRRLTDLQSQIEATQIATFKEELLKTYTKPKNPVLGGIYKKRHSRGFRLMNVRLRNQEEREENEEERETNEDGSIRNKINEEEERNKFEVRGEHWGVFKRSRMRDDDNRDADEDEDEDENENEDQY